MPSGAFSQLCQHTSLGTSPIRKDGRQGEAAEKYHRFVEENFM